jgi:hypothetical protein
MGTSCFAYQMSYTRGKLTDTHWVGDRLGRRISLDVEATRKLLHL